MTRIQFVNLMRTKGISISALTQCREKVEMLKTLDRQRPVIREFAQEFTLTDRDAIDLIARHADIVDVLVAWEKVRS